MFAKEDIKKENAYYQKRLESDLFSVESDLIKIGTRALIVGGTLAVSYLFISAIFFKGKKNKSIPAKVQECNCDKKENNGIIQAIQDEAVAIILSILKTKLLQFLNDEKAPNKD